MPVMTKSPAGEDIVILSRAEYETLTARANEDATDIAVGNGIMARFAAGTEETLTDAETDELLAAKTPLAFWRKKRGLTQAALSQMVGVAQGFLSDIEAGKKTGDVQTLRKIADSLSLTLDDLVA